MLVLSACDVPTPSVVVRFADPASADDAVRVEVSLLASCTGQVLGEPASAAITTVELTPTRSQPLGTFDRGDYGLYGRAFDASCTIVAAGCDTVTLGDDDPLEVTLASIAGGTSRTSFSAQSARIGASVQGRK